jgi:N-acyl-D-aspartate/D-glutamate deacylase
MSALLIRGGTVVDGSGKPGRQEDVRVRDGRIVERGQSLRPDSEPELDASGATVTPGFVDAHTHLDPWLWWDPSFDPVPQHGITTVVTGNCSLSLAPIGAHRAALVDMFSYIEDLPTDVFNEAVPWGWESWEEYMARARAVRSTVHVAPLVGLSALRLAVVGEAAFDRASTDQERAAIAAIARSSMESGAYGVSVSFLDTDSSGRPVPSQLADDAELIAIMEAMSSTGRGIVEFVIGSPDFGYSDIERMGRLSAATGVPATWVQLITRSGAPEHHRKMLEQAARLQADGADVRPQVSPRPLLFQLNLGGTIQFMGLEVWNDFVQAPAERKRELIADASWREQARDAWDNGSPTMFPRQDLARVEIVPTEHDRDQSALPATLAELHARRGGHPADVFLDWAAEHDMAPALLVTVANDDTQMVAELLTNPSTLVAASDIGAHVNMMSPHGDPTLLLIRHVLERGDLTLEAAVRRLTAEPAEYLGLHDCGVLEVGRRADVAVIDLDELEYLPQQLVHDLPNGASRFTRPAKGIRATVVAGEITQLDSALTGARPAGFLGSPAA